MRITFLVLAALCASAPVSTAGAQDQPGQERKHEGFWIGGGLGYGSANQSCDGCGSTDAESSVSGFLRLGGTLSEQLLLGVESDGWVKNIDGVNNTLGNLSGAVYFYPSRTAGLFLKGGAGMAGYSATDAGEKVDGYGLGLIGGVGYDIPIGRHSALTPVVSFNYGDLGDLKFHGTAVASGVKQTVVQVALSITGY